MMRRAAPPRYQRVTVLAAVFALHAALIALFWQQSTKVTPTIKPTAVQMLALDAERPAAAEPPPPALPAKLADRFKPLVEFSIPATSDSDAPAGASSVCATSAAVLDALLLDPAALDSIRSVPPEMRSIADAIVLWNEGWSSAALAPDAPLFIARASIERSLSAIAANCLDEPVAGPRLLPVPDAGGARTIFLVFGSGNWTWRALLVPPDIPQTASAAPPPVPPDRTP